MLKSHKNPAWGHVTLSGFIFSTDKTTTSLLIKPLGIKTEYMLRARSIY